MVENLERRVIMKDIASITCPNQICKLRGDYYKCYVEQQINCSLYVEYLVNIKTRISQRNLR